MFDAGDYLCNATNKFGWQIAIGSLVVSTRHDEMRIELKKLNSALQHLQNKTTRITDCPQDYDVEAGELL